MDDLIKDIEPKTLTIPPILLGVIRLYGPQLKKLAKDAAEQGIDLLFARLGVE